MNSSATPPEAPFAGEGGLAGFPRDEDDPYQALDDLMLAVEALCLVWPPRTNDSRGAIMLL